jgi:hypothetical protein
LVGGIDEVFGAGDDRPELIDRRRTAHVDRPEGGVTAVRVVTQIGALRDTVVEAPETDRLALTRAAAEVAVAHEVAVPREGVAVTCRIAVPCEVAVANEVTVPNWGERRT